nr:MAG TPA: hypothetical protein [Caudoviricetes sp.]
MKVLQEQYCELTEINIRETKMRNLVWFIWNKPNEYVIIFYQSTPPPLWERSRGA